MFRICRLTRRVYRLLVIAISVRYSVNYHLLDSGVMLVRCFDIFARFYSIKRESNMSVPASLSIYKIIVVTGKRS